MLHDRRDKYEFVRVKGSAILASLATGEPAILGDAESGTPRVVVDEKH